MGVEHIASTGIRPARSESLHSVFIVHFRILMRADSHVLRRHLSQRWGHRIIGTVEETIDPVYEYLMLTDL